MFNSEQEALDWFNRDKNDQEEISVFQCDCCGQWSALETDDTNGQIVELLNGKYTEYLCIDCESFLSRPDNFQ